MKIIKFKDNWNTYIKIDGIKGINELDFLLDFLRFLQKDNILNKNVLINGYEKGNKLINFTIKDAELGNYLARTDLWVYAPSVVKWSIDVDNDRINKIVFNNLSLCLQIFFEEKGETVDIVEQQ